MSGIDQRVLDAAADAYAGARREYERATLAAGQTYERLQASPETIEYQIDWNVARREEAAAAWRVKEAEERYCKAGGYVRESNE
ncbi:MAG TPA: hypothetical protein VMJ65_04015 [Solirubrobacteraceae bacterium]|nr:hypothetical protein [Solirubrobacteraceae bacterium]